MLEIASALSYAKFDDIKGLDSVNKMWDALATIYGGDTKILSIISSSILPVAPLIALTTSFYP